MVERVGVGSERLYVLEADNAAVRGVDGDVKYTARGKALDEGALLLDAEWRIERGVDARLDDRVENARDRFRIVGSRRPDCDHSAARIASATSSWAFQDTGSKSFSRNRRRGSLD